jgi:hypothetical protein
VLLKKVNFHMAATIHVFFIDSYVALLTFLVICLLTFILFHDIFLYSQFY